MNRNQKIALGCGGGGCLGLIVLLAVGIFGYLTYMRSSGTFANRNSNDYAVNTNSDSNFNSNSNTNSDIAVTDDASSTSLSEDEKHKLFQAAGITKDSELILRVLAKIGFPNGTGSGYETFVKEHFAWAMKNLDFMQTVNTPEKGRAYVEAHIDD